MSKPQFLIVIDPIQFTEAKPGQIVDIFLMNPGEYDHDYFGHFEYNNKKAKEAVKNFKEGNGTRKDDQGNPVIPINYNHGAYSPDPEISKNAGLIHEIYIDNKTSTTRAKAEFTAKALDYISNKEFLWFSPEFDENFEDENGEKHGFAFVGHALTNKNFLRKDQFAVKLMENGKFEFSGKDYKMELKDIIEALGVDSEEGILAAITELKEKAGTIDGLNTKITELENQLTELKEAEETKLSEGAVTISEKRLSELEEKALAGIEAKQELSQMKLSSEIDKYIHATDGCTRKVLPKMKASLMEIFGDNIEGFKKHAQTMPDLNLTDASGSEGDGPDQDKNEREILNDKVLAYQKENKIESYTDALRKYLSENPKS